MHLSPAVSWVMVAPAAWPSLVFGARFEPEQAEQQVRDIIGLVHRGQAPRSWFVGPSTRPVDLGVRLERLGFVKSSDSAAMAIDLLAMRDSVPWPPGLTISRVDTDRALYEWTRVLVQVMFQGDQTDTDEFYRLVSGLGLTADDVRFYMGVYEGKPVATSMGLLAGGIVGVYHVTTLPAYRNRGIGKHITLAPLLDARDRGYRAGTLFASRLGEVVYRQTGFEAYGRVSVYRLDAGGPHNASPSP